MDVITCGQLADIIAADERFFDKRPMFDVKPHLNACLRHFNRPETIDRLVLKLKDERIRYKVPYFNGYDALVGITDVGLLFANARYGWISENSVRHISKDGLTGYTGVRLGLFSKHFFPWQTL